jgi:FtsP/CotA-like multicopper oxidase with cupredoxin domain
MTEGSARTLPSFRQHGPDRIGRVYRQAVHRVHRLDIQEAEARGPNEERLGILGPGIRAEVGDTIKFVFKNNTRFPVSVHPHGVFYDKASEGAPYADGTTAATMTP